MKPSELRNKLKEWLSGELRIDRWGLNSPESVKDPRSPPSSGFDGKASGYSIASFLGVGESGSYLLETTIPFQVTYRFDSSQTYTEIPRAEAEDALAVILLKIESETNKNCLSPDIESIKSRGSVTVNEQAKSDWLLTFEIEFDVQFHCDFADLSEITGVFKT